MHYSVGQPGKPPYLSSYNKIHPDHRIATLVTRDDICHVQDLIYRGAKISIDAIRYFVKNKFKRCLLASLEIFYNYDLPLVNDILEICGDEIYGAKVRVEFFRALNDDVKNKFMDNSFFHNEHYMRFLSRSKIRELFSQVAMSNSFLIKMALFDLLSEDTISCSNLNSSILHALSYIGKYKLHDLEYYASLDNPPARWMKFLEYSFGTKEGTSQACGICLEEHTQDNIRVLTNCSQHGFCEKCISILHEKNYSKCPTCKKEIIKKWILKKSLK